MKIGMVGCGKLGLMVALTIESRGHEVKGYDISSRPAEYLAKKHIPFEERGAATLLTRTRMEMLELKPLCQWADILFLAPQTPHGPEYEGITPLPETRSDFDYSYLIDCVRSVDASLPCARPCVIISTVLPGTIERDILPIISQDFRLIYEPLFIAMGTVMEDFLHPEFVLAGSADGWALGRLKAFYRTIHDEPLLLTDIRTAEGIKVLYNTFITAKTVLANLYGELAHKCGMNVDDIYRAVCFSTDRLISVKYLKAGMGDGGACHPRDNIALSWLAREKDLSFDFFEALMLAREKHCGFLADLIEEHRGNLPVFILGTEFKPETNIKTGSPARLLSRILVLRGIAHSLDEYPQVPGLYFIGCQHQMYRSFVFPEGSIVIDPFRYLAQQDGVRLISIGKDDPTRDHRTLEPAHRA